MNLKERGDLFSCCSWSVKTIIFYILSLSHTAGIIYAYTYVFVFIFIYAHTCISLLHHNIPNGKLCALLVFETLYCCPNIMNDF